MSYQMPAGRPPQPQKYGHRPVQFEPNQPGKRSGFGPLVFFIAFIGLLALMTLAS